MGFVCGGVLLFEGWRLDPILLLCQVLASCMVIGTMSENIITRLTRNMLIETRQSPSRDAPRVSWSTVWYTMKLSEQWRRSYYD